MKYILILGDGMADHPIPSLGGKTPLQVANKPTIDALAAQGQLGIAYTIPEGMPPGSDTANMAVMGYDPKQYYTGRSPLEGISMGINLEPTDVSFRTNLVTLSEEEPYHQKTMLDHGANDIPTDQGNQLIKYINQYFKNETITFYPGVSYRNLLVWKEGSTNVNLTPPHDIRDQKITNYLPQGDHSQAIYELMQKSYHLLKDHPINIQRKKQGLNPANSIWIWGEGTRPRLASFKDKYNLQGTMISAVDLLKGIGICGGLKVVDVEGATGNIHTNFEGKAKAALKALEEGSDFVYIHIEAPDECSHCGELENKIKSIEYIDAKIVKLIKEKMDKKGEDYKIMILPDHPTPVALKTHTSDPVPFLIYDSTNIQNNSEQSYDEQKAKDSNIIFQEGYKLMDYFIKGGKQNC